jgi:uncharacterized protein YutE (UPF0331/DUF86 family)
MPDEVVLAKAASIERAVARARQEYGVDVATFVGNLTRMDAATLNVQRACETAIDLAQHVVRLRALGNPGSARELFAAIESANLIDAALSASLQRMVGFRNIAVHEYQKIQPEILVAIIERNLDDVLKFASAMLRQTSE